MAKLKLDKILKSNNIAENLDEERLLEIGADVSSGFDTDLDSRKPWEKDLSNWTKLALQISEEKTFPWPNAANICSLLPVLTQHLYLVTVK
jgi:hypothetical protein